MGLKLYATPGTAEALRDAGHPLHQLAKGPADGARASTPSSEGSVDLVINIPREYDEGRPDGYGSAAARSTRASR